MTEEQRKARARRFFDSLSDDEKKRMARKLWDEHVVQSRVRNQAVTAKRLSDAGRRGCWRRWHRDRVITESLPMVARIARDVRRMFARHLDFGDLTQAGSVGLVKAANSYHPSRGAFAPYAYFHVRGAIIDSQKRRTYQEESNVSLNAIADAHDGWLPPRLDTDRAPLPDEQAAKAQIALKLRGAIAALPDTERRVLLGQLQGRSLTSSAREVGLSVRWTQAKLQTARELVGVMVRGE